MYFMGKETIKLAVSDVNTALKILELAVDRLIRDEHKESLAPINEKKKDEKLVLRDAKIIHKIGRASCRERV